MMMIFFFFQAEDGIRDIGVTGVQTCALPIFDTPGVHQPGYLLNRRMMAAVHDALEGVDLVCLIRDASVSTGNGDRFVLDLVKRSAKPALLLLNKTDKVADKSQLLPLIEWYSREHEWRGVVPLSARRGDALDALVREMV